MSVHMRGQFSKKNSLLWVAIALLSAQIRFMWRSERENALAQLAYGHAKHSRAGTRALCGPCHTAVAAKPCQRPSNVAGRFSKKANTPS